MRKLVLALALAVAGCATKPINFHRIDGKPADQQQQQQFAADKVVCQGEMQKAHLAMPADKDNMFAVGDLQQVYVGCMAQRGYLADQ